VFGFKRRRRRRLRQMPFPPVWLAILELKVAYYEVLSPEDRRELLGHIQVFLNEKSFEGCGGLEMTDEIRVTIAAHACVLLLHRRTDYYPLLQSILVYPHHYFVETSRPNPDGTVDESVEDRLGESWGRGAIVLSWRNVVRDAADASDGRNVVFHEFAHQLDAEGGPTDGTPLLGKRSRYAAWAEVLGREYERLIEDVRYRRPMVLDPYGTKNPAEFFAVATEAFFERSVALKDWHPELYEQFMGYFRQDPAARFEDDEPEETYLH